MTLSSVRAGDIVLAEVKGRAFYALVEDKNGRQLRVRPIDNRITYRSVTAREVTGHWLRSRRGR